MVRSGSRSGIWAGSGVCDTVRRQHGSACSALPPSCAQTRRPPRVTSAFPPSRHSGSFWIAIPSGHFRFSGQRDTAVHLDCHPFRSLPLFSHRDTAVHLDAIPSGHFAFSGHRDTAVHFGLPSFGHFRFSSHRTQRFILDCRPFRSLSHSRPSRQSGYFELPPIPIIFASSLALIKPSAILFQGPGEMISPGGRGGPG